jgi:hypothetical protein
MTCQECQDLMLEVARDRAAPFIQRAVQAHAASCGACAGNLLRERAVTAGLRAVALDAAGSTASSDLEARLMKAFASQVDVATRDGFIGSSDVASSAVRAKRWLLPLAAAVALGAAGLTWWVTRSPRVSAPMPAIAAVQAPVSAIQPGEAPRPDRPTPADRARPVRRTLRPQRKAPIQAVGFVPIPSAAGLPAFESGQIVRLGIPVAALPNYGVQIPSGGESSIQADLLVGQDGQPRAIRLVSASASPIQDAHPRH